MLVLSNKKNAECEHCTLNLILGNMSTATLETASQIGLRNCFKYMVGGGWGVEGKDSIYVIMVKGDYMQ